MKKILRVALVLCGISGFIAVAVQAADVSNSNSAPTPAQAREKNSEAMAERLGLTPDQRTKLETLRQSQRKELDAVAADKTSSPDERRQKVRKIMDSHRDEMKAVLTPEQQKKMGAVRERFARSGHHGSKKFERGHHSARRDHGRKHFRHGRGHSREMRHAMLTRGKLRHQRERRAEQLGLSDEQRAKLRQVAFQHREKLIGLQKDLRTEMESVLTPEQQARAKELKAGHGRHGAPGQRDDHGRDRPSRT